MIYSIDLQSIAGQLNYLNVCKYLAYIGWTQRKTKRNYVNIFEKKINETDMEIEVPNTRDVADYNWAMYKAVEIIALSENKSIEQKILELLNPLSDIIRIRSANDDIENGSILFDEAVSLYENAKKVIFASAMDVLTPRFFHYGKPNSNIQSFLGNCRFGQTEIGSYIVSVICPFIEFGNSNDFEQLSLFSDIERSQDSFTRKTTEKLITSISVVKNLIETNNIDQIFDRFEEYKISANYLEAIKDINNTKDTKGTIDISVSWAPTIPNDKLDNPKVSLTKDYREPLNYIINKMKSKTSGRKSYFGNIYGVHANPDVSKRSTGEVSFVFLDENNRASKAIVTLSSDEYSDAVMAHKDGNTVCITGVLKATPKKKYIQDPEFSIIECK